jgi:DTW domain-containing protein YfiP
MTAIATTSSAPACPRCHKPMPLCVCADIVPMDNRIGVLILQHPQEQDADLGTAHLTALHFKNASVRIGLSWPSLAKALGRPADPKHWATLYLGSVKPASLLPGQDVIALTRRGAAHPDQRGQLTGLQGVILLDGTWSQAKALWWRNPWLLKTARIVLGPRQPSRYGRLRREARREAISTLEATALLLSKLEDRPDFVTALHASFEKLLDRYRERTKAAPLDKP